jgi:hypothetical protein
MRHCFSRLVAAIAVSGLISGCKPAVMSFSPQHGSHCDAVTFVGSSMFGSLDQVSFNGVPSVNPKYGPASSLSPPSFFTASVPPTATRGPIEVHFGDASILALPTNLILTPDFVVDPDPPTPTAQFTITPLTTTVGGTVSGTWTTSNATSVTLDNRSVANAAQDQPIMETKAGVDSHHLTAIDHYACFSDTVTQNVAVNYVQGSFTEVPALQTSGNLASPNGSCVLNLNSGSASGTGTANYKCGSLAQGFEFGVRQIPSVGGAGFSSSSSGGNRSGIVLNASSSNTTPSFPVTVYGIDLLNLHATDVTVAYGHKANEPDLPVRVFISPDGTLMLITSFTNQIGCTNHNAYCFTVLLYDLVANKTFPGNWIYDGGTGINTISATVGVDGVHQVVTGTANGQPLNFVVN